MPPSICTCPVRHLGPVTWEILQAHSKASGHEIPLEPDATLISDGVRDASIHTDAAKDLWAHVPNAGAVPPSPNSTADAGQAQQCAALPRLEALRAQAAPGQPGGAAHCKESILSADGNCPNDADAIAPARNTTSAVPPNTGPSSLGPASVAPVSSWFDKFVADLNHCRRALTEDGSWLACPALLSRLQPRWGCLMGSGKYRQVMLGLERMPPSIATCIDVALASSCVLTLYDLEKEILSMRDFSDATHFVDLHMGSLACHPKIQTAFRLPGEVGAEATVPRVETVSVPQHVVEHAVGNTTPDEDVVEAALCSFATRCGVPSYRHLGIYMRANKFVEFIVFKIGSRLLCKKKETNRLSKMYRSALQTCELRAEAESCYSSADVAFLLVQSLISGRDRLESLHLVQQDLHVMARSCVKKKNHFHNLQPFVDGVLAPLMV